MVLSVKRSDAIRLDRLRISCKLLTVPGERAKLLCATHGDTTSEKRKSPNAPVRRELFSQNASATLTKGAPQPMGGGARNTHEKFGIIVRGSEHGIFGMGTPSYVLIPHQRQAEINQRTLSYPRQQCQKKSVKPTLDSFRCSWAALATSSCTAFSVVMEPRGKLSSLSRGLLDFLLCPPTVTMHRTVDVTPSFSVSPSHHRHDEHLCLECSPRPLPVVSEAPTSCGMYGASGACSRHILETHERHALSLPTRRHVSSPTRSDRIQAPLPLSRPRRHQSISPSSQSSSTLSADP